MEACQVCIRKGLSCFDGKTNATLTEDAEALSSIACKTRKTLMTPYELNHSHHESAANQVAMGVLVQQQVAHTCLLS